MMTTASEPATLLDRIHRFTVAQYHELDRLGFITTADRVELLNGLIVQKVRISPPHAYTVRAAFNLLDELLDESWHVRTQNPVTLSESEPEPDVVVAKGPIARYNTAHPKPNEIELVIEVADSSLVQDLTTKLAIYATAKIPQYWVVNLTDRCVELFTLPRGGKSPRYRQQVTIPADGDIAVSLRGQVVGTVSVREFLP